jgi:hypothetical protein
MSNRFRSLYATAEIPYDIAVSIEALSTQRQNTAETGGKAPNHIFDRLHCDGSQSSLCPEGEFLGRVALFMVDQTLYHSHTCSMGLRSGLLAGQ